MWSPATAGRIGSRSYRRRLALLSGRVHEPSHQQSTSRHPMMAPLDRSATEKAFAGPCFTTRQFTEPKALGTLADFTTFAKHDLDRFRLGDRFRVDRTDRALPNPAPRGRPVLRSCPRDLRPPPKSLNPVGWTSRVGCARAQRLRLCTTRRTACSFDRVRTLRPRSARASRTVIR